jgi:ATP-dependent Clp protease protease subunit
MTDEPSDTVKKLAEALTAPPQPPVGLLGLAEAAQSAPPPINEIYALFAGMIDQDAVRRLFNGLTTAITNRIDRMHLLLQSTGGSVSDGVCLYNFFRTLPIELKIYNCGSVSSIAAIAYLGAQSRKVSAHATFMLHRTHISPQMATAERLQALANTIGIDDQRTEAILRDRLTLSDDKWAIHRMTELWFNTQEAVECGLADEVAEFAPPKGSMVFSLTA